MVWQENFDAATLNSNYWTYDFGNGCERALCGWGNSELEYYTSRTENVRLENGSLVIEARKENFQGNAFTSGRIKTEGRMHFTYGTVEARIKVPDLKNGLWPALWTLGTVGGVWPKIGEIDILEMGAKAALQANLANKRVSGAAHYDNNGTKADGVGTFDSPIDLSLDYHIYKMVWTPTTITMYLDGSQYFTFDISNPNISNKEEFHHPHFLLLNMAVGGAYTDIFSTAGITAPLPAKMLVDYVKLYQSPGEQLILGTATGAVGNFGILTETTPVSDSLQFGTDATLYYWNNINNIANPTPVAFEGNRLLAVRAAAGDWFGFGVDNHYINLNYFTTGSLKFHFKTTYGGQFKFGIKTGHGESWMNFAAGTNKYGLVRDGNWHEVTIPLADFSNSALGMNIDLWSVKGAFMFAGDPASGVADFYFDNIYYSGGVSPNPAPSVQITSPTAFQIFTNPSAITIQASAADANGTVSKVEFYNGTTLLGTDVSAPYELTWSNPPLGVDTLYAKATDNENGSTVSQPIIIFIAPNGNSTPSVSIVSPLANAAFFTPAEITITANALDADAGIYSVAFYKGVTLLATDYTAPFEYKWMNAPEGNHTLLAVATDKGGLTNTSISVPIVVQQPVVPQVSITAPANNSSFVPPATITITANASDANGTISKVEFFQGNLLISTDNDAPYTSTWSNVPLGVYNLTAKATDNDGNATVSSIVTVAVKPVACTGTVANGDYSYEVYSAGGIVYFRFHPLTPIAGSTSAIIYLREGNGGGAYPGYNMTAAGTDFIYSKTIANTTATSFYFSYNVPAGGERNSSATPHSYVAGTTCVAGAPTIAITSPTEGAGFTAPASVTFTVTANDQDGTVSRVDYYNGATLIGSNTSSPFGFTWTNVTAGAYAITAKATDNNNLTTTSLPVNIVVSPPNANGYCGTAASNDYEYKAVTNGNTVTFTMHPLNAVVGSAYAFIYIRETVGGGYPGYTMQPVGGDFVFTKTIATGTNISYYFTYQIPAGGERNSSANPHSYTTGANCTGVTGAAPIVSISSPINNASFTEPATIALTANASDADGTIAKVEFFNGATLLSTRTTSPYSFNWTPVAAGNYSITAKATDNNNLSTISAPINLLVNINHSAGFCATVANGDYSYRAETSGGVVTFIFHPLTPIAGSKNALIYVREGGSGGYPGYGMTAVGADFRFTKAIPNGTVCSIYFTYSVPSGGERNSSATPHSYTVGSTCAINLPVTLLAYQALATSNASISVNWTTGTEQNNAYFLVEKSNDGRNFKPWKKVVGAGFSNQPLHYEVIETNPSVGVNYYRLSQVDKDGRITIFGIKSVAFNNKRADFGISPNPVKQQVSVTFPTQINAALHFVIQSVDGKIIYQSTESVQGSSVNITLPKTIVAGIYLLTIEGIGTKKLIVE